HRLGGCGKEVATILPHAIPVSDELEKGFVHECRRLQRLTRRLARHFCGGETAQLCINQRQHFRGLLRLVVVRRLEDAIEVAHQILTWPSLSRKATRHTRASPSCSRASAQTSPPN